MSGRQQQSFTEYTLNLLVYLTKNEPVNNKKLYNKFYEHLEETQNTT